MATVGSSPLVESPPTGRLARIEHPVPASRKSECTGLGGTPGICISNRSPPPEDSFAGKMVCRAHFDKHCCGHFP